jgi:glycosyltransferase involved in cell wall biosynthesis
MPHGMLDPSFQKAKERKWKAVRNYFFWKLLESKAVNGADEVLFTCEQEKLLARQAFTPYKPKKETVVRYGILPPPPYVDTMKTAFEEACPEEKNQNYILFLSRVHVKKGVGLLLKAYLKLKKENVRLPKLVIAGPGMDSAYGKELLQLAAGDKDILFAGMLAGNAKWGAFYGCECFALPSHQENFGIAVVEALACKKPVLISKQVNTWREIEKENGGIFDDDTEDGVYRMLRQWQAMSEEQKIEMSNKAFSAYNKYFNLAESNDYC